MALLLLHVHTVLLRNHVLRGRLQHVNAQLLVSLVDLRLSLFIQGLLRSSLL